MTGMSDDQLRARLARLDPAPAGSPLDPPVDPPARDVLERIVQTSPTPAADTSDGPGRTDELAAARRRPWLLAVAAAVLLVALVGGLLTLTGGNRAPGGDDPTTLALELPPSDAAGSCVVFDVQFLAGMPVAFGGTVTAMGDEQVTLQVDRWYRGGDADQVTLAIAEGQSSAALDGVDFRVGERYLVTATDGTVNGCGFSGPADPQLEQAFEEAFGS
jgi:hypothetical protein